MYVSKTISTMHISLCYKVINAHFIKEVAIFDLRTCTVKRKITSYLNGYHCAAEVSSSSVLGAMITETPVDRFYTGPQNLEWGVEGRIE